MPASCHYTVGVSAPGGSLHSTRRRLPVHDDGGTRPAVQNWIKADKPSAKLVKTMKIEEILNRKMTFFLILYIFTREIIRSDFKVEENK